MVEYLFSSIEQGSSAQQNEFESQTSHTLYVASGTSNKAVPRGKE